MALNFPLNPSDGDTYQGYVYDATDGVWNANQGQIVSRFSTSANQPDSPTQGDGWFNTDNRRTYVYHNGAWLESGKPVTFSETAPLNQEEGTLWFNTTVGKMFVYYNDGTSSQWVSAIGGIAGQSGTEGQMLIHDGTEWVAYDGGSRNLLYNGAMQVAQRGTSSTGITFSGYHTADRWNEALSSLGTWTQTLESDGPTGSGFTKSLKMECTTANASPGASALLTVRQMIEGQDLQGLKKGTSDAESLTISFWAKSNVTGTYILSLIDEDNNRSISASYTISSAGAWEKKTITFAGDTTGAFDNDNNSSLRVQFWLGVGSDRSSGTLQTSWGTTVTADIAVGQTNLAASTGNYWQITGVQLEAGTVATPFEHKSYATELAECQRYYQKSGNDLNNYWIPSSSTGVASDGITMSAFPSDTNRASPKVDFKVTMRAAPTMTYYAARPELSNPSGVINTYNGPTQVTYSAPASASVTGIYGYFQGLSLSGGNYTFQFEADAEL